jgi:uncharacterized membrane protein YagU involved in acid resistance
MATLQHQTARTTSPGLPVVATIGALGGAVAGMMMAMVEMIYGGLADGHTIWDAPMAIWAWVAGSDQFGAPSDHVGAIVLGMGGHLANSMMLGVGFAVLAAVLVRRSDTMTSVALGTMFGLLVWVGTRYVLLPLNDSAADLFTGSAVSPQWLWWLAHSVFGMTLGLVYARLAARSSSKHLTA